MSATDDWRQGYRHGWDGRAMEAGRSAAYQDGWRDGRQDRDGAAAPGRTP